MTAGGIILTALAIGIYFLPSFIAWSKPKNGGIIALNILLGWTFLGWVAALIWAIQAPGEVKSA